MSTGAAAECQVSSRSGLVAQPQAITSANTTKQRSLLDRERLVSLVVQSLQNSINARFFRLFLGFRLPNLLFATLFTPPIAERNVVKLMLLVVEGRSF